MALHLAKVIGVLLLAGMAAQVTAAVEPPALVNPGFEEGMKGWKTWVARAPVKAEVVPGERGNCLRLRGEAGSRVNVSQTVSVAPQQCYRVRFRYLAGPNGAGGGSLGFFRVTFTDPNGKFLDYPCAVSLLDTFGRWVEVERVVKTPLSIGTLDVAFNNSGASEVLVDDLSLEAVPTPPQPPNTWAQLVAPRKERPVFSAWQYNNDAPHFQRMALKYGWRYRYEEQFDQLRDTGTIGFWGGEETYRRYARRGIRACIYLHHDAEAYRKAHYDGEPPADYPAMLDPVWHDGYVAACKEACAKWGKSPGIAYFFVVDEAFGKYRGAITAKEKRLSPDWARLDAEVRQRFGGGVHGLPDGPDDDNPYRWIAYYSWAGDQLARTFARLRQVIDDSGCGAKLLGPDEFGAFCPLPWADLARSADLFVGQSLPISYTARAYTPGFITRCALDMTGKPVHNATQIVSYGGSPSPEEVQRRYSQVLQNGGEGQMLIAVEWFDRELNHHQHSAPERWATVCNFLRLMAENRVRTPTESAVSILCSSPSLQAQGRSLNDSWLQTAYALCGPVVGAWPRMIDSDALAKGQTPLTGKIVLVPYAPYERPAVLRQLEAFAREGGLVLFCDPGALARDTLGGELPSRALLGAMVEPVGRRREMRLEWPAASRQRVYAEECFALQPDPGATVIGRYEDGSVAAIRRPFGKGEVILFGGNPVASTAAADDPEWASWWKALLTTHAVPVDLPIWRLRLPDDALVQARKPEDVCLTGNSLVRCQNGAYLGANETVAGHYTLSVAPDLAPESGGANPVPFARGNLTNRLLAEKGPFNASRVATTPYQEADWANRWSGTALAGGLEVEFTLPEARDLTRLCLWFSGDCPDLVVEGATDGGWKRLARVKGESVGADVVDLTVPVRGAATRVRLRFAKGAGSFALGEVEIWAAANR